MRPEIPARKLLLFDIAGTLLTTHGLGRTSVAAALRRVLGRDVPFDALSFSGKTDPQIFREILRLDAGADEGTFEETFRATLDAYQEEVHARVGAAAIEAFPGAQALVERLADDDRVALGLVTGNLREMAYLKLDRLGLSSHFPFGAFGCDHEDRNCLVPIAVERAEAHTGRRFDPAEVVVIGDTPRDIACARAAGAVAVAVATGHVSREQLAAENPDVLLDTLEQFSFGDLPI